MGEADSATAPSHSEQAPSLRDCPRSLCDHLLVICHFKSLSWRDNTCFISRLFPQLLWIVDYKLLFFISFIAIIALIFSRWRAIWFIMYIAIYPMILICFRLPYFIFRSKSWLLLFHIANLVANFIRTFRYRIISFSIFSVSFIVCLVAHNWMVLVISATALCLLLVFTILRILGDLIRPQPLFSFYKQCFNYLGTTALYNLNNHDKIRGVPLAAMTDMQLSIYKANLGQSVLVNRVLLFIGKRLRDFQESTVGVVGGIILFFGMWLFTIFCFYAINIAVFRIDPAQFHIDGEPSAFMWFRYAFYNFVYVGIREIEPVGSISQACLSG